MAPFSSQPAVIVVQPSNHCSNVEGAIDGIENIGSTRNSGTMWNDSTFDYGSEEFSAFFESKSFQAAADGVEKDVACGFVLLVWRVNGGRARILDKGLHIQRDPSRSCNYERSWPYL